MEETTPEKSQSSSRPNHSSEKNGYVRFTGLAFELLGILIVGVGGGYSLDNYFQNDVPYLTLIFSLFSLIGVIVYLWKRLPKD